MRLIAVVLVCIFHMSAHASLNCSLRSTEPTPTIIDSCPELLYPDIGFCLMSFTADNGEKGYYLLKHFRESMFGPLYSVLKVAQIDELIIENDGPIDNSNEGKFSHQISWARPIVIDWQTAPGGSVKHHILCNR